MILTKNPEPVMRVALLDFNGGRVNRGTGALQKLALDVGFDIVDTFDVRKKQLPRVSDYKVFLCTGGPNDPREWGQNNDNPDDNWGQGVFNVFDDILDHNTQHPNEPKRLVTICHSFQMFCHHKELGELHARENGTLIGIHPHYPTPDASEAKTTVFGNAPKVLYTFESRDYRVTPIDCADGKSDYIPVTMDAHGSLTSIASRDGNIIGMQFHPEATAEQVGPMLHLESNIATQEAIIKAHGKDALDRMRENVSGLTTTHDILRDFVAGSLCLQKLQLAA